MQPRTIPATDIELITKSMATKDTKCSVMPVKTINYLCIPVENERHYEIMCAFLKNCGIEPRKKTLVKFAVMISEQHISKLADLLRQDENLFNDFALIFIGIDQAIQSSSYVFDAEIMSMIVKYEFMKESGSEALKSMAPDLITRRGTFCEMKPRDIIELSADKRNKIITNIHHQLNTYCNQQDSVKKFIECIPKAYLLTRPIYENELLTVKFPTDCIPILKPVLTYAGAMIFAEGVCKIGPKAFKKPEFIETVRGKMEECVRRLEIVSTFQRSLLILNDYQYLLENNLFCIRFKSSHTTAILKDACKLAGIKFASQDAHQVNIDCHDIFNLNEVKLETWQTILQQCKKDYISKNGNTGAITQIKEETRKELECLSIIRSNDARTLDQYIKTHGLDVNQPFTVDKFVGATMVMLATTQGCEAVLACLIDKHKAEFKKPITSGIHAGMTPLYAAAHMGETKTLQMLIDAGADCNQPLQDILIEPGSNDSGQHFVGRRPIFAASSAGHAPAVECLIRNGADFTTPLENGESKGMTVFANAVIHARADVVTLLLLHDVDHTAKITKLSPIAIAKKAGENINKRKDAATIIKLLKDETQCMEIMREFFMTHPFATNAQAYTWVKSNQKIHLTVPCSEHLIPYLITFLDNQAIECEQLNKTTLIIPKTHAKRLVGIIDANQSAWTNYMTFISNLGACIRSSSYNCESLLTNIDLRLSISDPRKCGISELLAEPYVEETDVNTYVIPLIKIIQLKPDISAQWANAFLEAVKSYKEELEQISNYLASCLSQCSNIAENVIKNGCISAKLNARSTALARPLLTALNSEHSDGMYWLSVTNYLELSEDQRLSLMNEIKLRHRIFDAITLLSSRVGQRKINYREQDLMMKYNKALDAERFIRIINTHTQLATLSGAVVTLNYDALFTLEDNALSELNNLFHQDTQRLTREANVIQSMTRALNLFEPEKICWSVTDNVLQTNSSAVRTIALLQLINLPGLIVENTPALIARLDKEAIFCLTELELDKIAEVIATASRKNKIISNFLHKANSSGIKSTETQAGIELFCLDVEVRNCLISSCSSILSHQPNNKDVMLLDYNKLLNLDIEALEQSTARFVDEIQAYKLRNNRSKPKPAAVALSKQEVAKDPAVAPPNNANKPTDTPSSGFFSGHKNNKSKKKKQPVKKKESQSTPPEKKRALTKAERRARGIPPQPPIDTRITNGKIYSDPDIAKKSLAANPEQYSLAPSTQNERLHVISSSRFFTCNDTTNTADAINDLLEELSICVANYDYYNNEQAFDTNEAIKEMLKLLRDLKALSHFLKQPNEFNLLIRLFLRCDLEAFSSASVNKTPSKETIVKTAQRGSELWRATQQVDSLLSMNI